MSSAHWYLTHVCPLIPLLKDLTAKLTSTSVPPTPASTRAPALMMWLDTNATVCSPTLVRHVAAYVSLEGLD